MSKMYLSLLGLVLAGALVLPLATTANAESRTVRIETDPARGAVITEEAGVLVFRGVPSAERVIVNPGGVTPLALGVVETQVFEDNRSVNLFQRAPRRLPANKRRCGTVYNSRFGC